jgi:translation initiation factor 2 subunit 2
MKAKYEYDTLLERIWGRLPDKLKKHERYELPEADAFIEGNVTIIRNYNEIVSALGRRPEHILKFLSKELAAPASIDGARAIIQRKLKKHVVDGKIRDYAKGYVICHECGRPDTKVSELEGQRIIKCEACGGWWPMHRIK